MFSLMMSGLFCSFILLMYMFHKLTPTKDPIFKIGMGLGIIAQVILLYLSC